ncbi:protein Shroom2 isoform X3 [Esox lucius]|uniref:Shroom family member 2 n=1 Tax=Esox lucius TaxID=8010 RepID=A0A3P8YME6_ESOLU|nr:protein Shroom2 isoform X3 [Esox lucius]
MDIAGDNRRDARYSDGDHKQWLMDRRGDMDQRSRDGVEGWRLVEVLLSGGAPWGFTLKGGREHREALLITKVEEGSEAAAVGLQTGDEIVNINQVPLTGYRQEAICLVKGSHRTLTLVVKRVMRMVDIVASGKMPSETDVHVARSFLTKILRSSMRKNEPVSRPHSWHATKFNEIQSETVKTQSSLRYDASSSSTDLSSGGWDQTNLRRGSDQFSSLGSMDSLDPGLGQVSVSQQPSGHLSPAKSHTSTEHLGGGKRDSAYSSFSTSSGTPDHTLSKTPDYTKTPDHTFSKTPDYTKTPDHTLSQTPDYTKTPDHTLSQTPDYTKTPDHTLSQTPDYTKTTLSKNNASSTENMLYKVSHWDSGGRSSNTRSSIDGARQDERPVYLQLAGGQGAGKGSFGSDKLPGSRLSSSSVRTSSGPVWHVPDKKKTSAPSSPPPPPPLRSDSFAATKSHEKGLVMSCADGVEVHSPPGPAATGLAKEMDPDDNIAGRGHHPLTSKTVTVPHYVSPESSNQNQLYASSSGDVKQGQRPHHQRPHHQRQRSDETPLYSQPHPSSGPRKHNTTGYYSSMQELPTNYSNQNPPLYSKSRTRPPNTPLSSSTMNQTADSPGASRCYCVAARQPGQTVTQALLVKTDDRRGAGGERCAAASEGVRAVVDRISPSPQGPGLTKYQPPVHPNNPPPYPSNKDMNGYPQQDNPRHKQTVAVTAAGLLDSSTCPASSEDQTGRRRSSSQTVEPHYMSYPPSRQADQRRSLSLQQDNSNSTRPGPFSPQDTSTTPGPFSPKTSPMLHSLSQEAPGLGARECPSKEGGQEAPDPFSDKQCKRSERFATTLRNEIQMRRARLQNSQSSADLSGQREGEEDEAPGVGTSNCPSSDGSFTSTYKDHLKEAQARVLKATSFRRKDLELVVLEHPRAEAGSLPGFPSSGAGKKANHHLPSLSEDMPARSGSAQGQVTRIGGRKRFTAEKKVRSFSEPDKINEVGVDEGVANPEAVGSSISRPAFTRPAPTASLQASVEDCCEAKEATGGTCIPSSRPPPEGGQCLDLVEQQRLGTFAEYEATWNVQKKLVEIRPSSRYHSADNILDPGGQDLSKPAPVHERSRSSPSSDFYSKTQNVPAPGRKSAEYCQPESNPIEQKNPDTRHSGWKTREKTEELEDFPEPPSPVIDQEATDIRPPAVPYDPTPNLNRTPDYHRPTSIPDLNPTPDYHRPTSIPDPALDTDRPPPPDLSNPTNLHLHYGPRRNAPVPPPTRQDQSIEPENSHSQESHPGSEGRTSTYTLLIREHSPAPVSTHSPRKDSEKSRGLLKETIHPAVPSSPGPALPTLPRVARPSMEDQVHRSPSPQFAPQRLTDKPPVLLHLHQDSPGSDLNTRVDAVMESSGSSVRKVPIQIVHSETQTEKERRQYLLQHSDSAEVGSQVPGLAPLSSLGPSGDPDQSYSLFCAYSRQRDPASVLPPPPAPYTTSETGQHRDPDEAPFSYQAALLQSLPCQQIAPPPNGPSQQKASPLAPPHDPPGSNDLSPSGPVLHSEEDLKREELARDILNKDRSLADILDQSGRRTTMDLMEGLFPQGEVLLEGKARRKFSPKDTKSPHPSEDRNDNSVAAAAALVTNSAYYSTSAPKAELLIKLKDMQEREELEEEVESEEELDHDLAIKKQELVDSLSRKLQVLREARESLQEDVQDNNALGLEVEATVQQLCKPNQLDKFRMFVGDLDKVVSLLLSLSGRLARVENALNSLEEDVACEERRTLMEKRKLLVRQHEDAKELKENLDRREKVVYDILASYLKEESLADYEHFVKMKSALIIEQRKLDDKIKLGEEQLKCLMDSLPLEQRVNL